MNTKEWNPAGSNVYSHKRLCDRYDPDGVEWGFVNIHAINMEYLRHS
jgi:hypothetical protein